jgi:hypothetical protein
MKREEMLKKMFWGLVILLVSSGISRADTHYVSAGQSIQDAINAASNGDQIEVAPGTYNETINFNGKSVRLYSSGGANVTVINGTGYYHVVQCVSGEDADTILDGFTITGGNSQYSQGGGMFNSSSSPTVTNCKFSGNNARDGGGMCNYQGSSPAVTNCTFSGNMGYLGGGMCNDQSSNPTVTGCIFLSNTATLHGGGIHNEHSDPNVTNCIFQGNTAFAHGGGMMNNYGSLSYIANCIFSGNTAKEWGGGICNVGVTRYIINCTFSGNTAAAGGAINNNNSSANVLNSILWGDVNEIVNNSGSVAVTYSDVQGGFAGAGNINADPCFVNVASGDFRLKSRSPCIDKGNNSGVTAATDLDGNPRIVDGDGDGTATVDMGPYEVSRGNTGLKGTVVGVDSAGKVSGPLAGAVVTLSGPETVSTVTDSNGKFSLINISAGDYLVTITKPGYYGVDSEIYIGENETLNEIFQLAYMSGSQSPVGYDFVSPHGRHFINGAPGDISFEITIAWNGSPGDVRFCIGNNCYPAAVTDLGGGLAKASLTMPAPSIVDCSSKLIIDVVNGNGVHALLNTDVRFHAMPDIIHSWYEDNIPWISLGLSLSYLDERSFIWQLPLKNKDISLDASFAYSRGLNYDLMSGTFSGSLGGNGGFNLKVPVGNKDLGVKFLSEGKVGLAGTLKVGLTDCLPVITPGWQVSFTGKVGAEAPVIVVVDVFFPAASPALNTMRKIPVVNDIINALKVRVYIIKGLNIAGIYKPGEPEVCFLGSTQIDVSGTIGLEVQVDLSAGPASVGVYAGGTGTPSFEICPDFKFNSVTINAYVGTYAKMAWFKVSKKYGCSITFGSSNKGAKALSEQLFDAASEPVVTWELASDSLKRWGPANRPVGSTARMQAFTLKTSITGSEAQTIAENVIDTASPSVVSDASQTMLLFTLHDISKPDYGASDIGTFVSAGGGTWSAGRIADDSNSDFVAKVASVGSDSYLAAWERISGDVSEINDPNQIDQIYPHMEIAASWFDRNTGVWSALTEITSNNLVDRSPLPVVYGSTTGIVWIQNDANYTGNSEHGDRLMFSEWTGSGWGAPWQLWSGPYGILSFSFASDSDNQGHIVFAVDLDGNTDETRTDRELYGISTSSGIWGPAQRLTNNDVEDSHPVIVNPNGEAIVVWDSNDTLLYTPLGTWNPRQVYSQYTLNNEAATLAGVTMADGAAIAYTVQGPSGVDIMASFYDAILDRWSLPRQLTFDEDVESAVSLGFDGDRLIAAYLKTKTERSAVDVEINGQMQHIENVPEPGRTDLCVLQHKLGYDLSVDSNSVVLEPANPEPGSTATIKATVVNSGDLGAENIAVAFYDGNPDSGGSIIGDTRTISGNWIPGGANEVSVSWDVPADSNISHEIFAVVDPCLAVDDRDRSNNTASKFAVLPDVGVGNSWSTELSPKSVMLTARVANTGVTAARQVRVSWRIGSEEGTEIGSDSIPTLASGGVYEAACVWDVNHAFDSNDYVKVFGVVSSAVGVPDFDELNNSFSLLVNNPSPEKPPVAEAGPDQTVYAWIDGVAEVTLDGSDSNDPQSNPLTYKWSWTIDSNTPEANGVKPAIELPVGNHVISLVVNDGTFDSVADEVNITVIGPIEANLCVMPRVINCRSFQPNVTAMLRLPKGITIGQIDTNAPIVLYPGQIKADWKWINRYFDYKCRAWSAIIFASFDKNELMSAIDDDGLIEVAVVGQLKTGQYFYGSDTINVIHRGHPWIWHRPWCDYGWNLRFKCWHSN